jgi:hypothetical protein
MNVTQQPAPADSLLRTYLGGDNPERWGQYGDCFSVQVSRPVTLEEFVVAFYTTWVFRLERRILRLVIGTPSTDAQARGVATGTEQVFAAWAVGARSESQLLMCDRYETTRSWFRVLPNEGGTTLQFGSAVASAPGRGAAPSTGRGFRLLLGFHVLYSKVLLRAAAKRLLRSPELKPL